MVSEFEVCYNNGSRFWRLMYIMGKDMVINSNAIRAMLGNRETQIILQRHCNYDRSNGELLDDSKGYQRQIVGNFLKDLDDQNLNDVYFLFTASNTVNSRGERKRCVDTINIAISMIQEFLESRGVSEEHIINLDEDLNYGLQVKEVDSFSEPKMLTDETGYFEFLKDKNGVMNKNFWIDFEEDKYKNVRQELGSEGPDEIVDRGIRYINIIERFSEYFHIKKPNSKLIVWCGTHYDLISPLVKQTIFGYEKSDYVGVDYCGGISLKIDESHLVTANVNGDYYPVSFEDIRQRRRHL